MSEKAAWNLYIRRAARISSGHWTIEGCRKAFETPLQILNIKVKLLRDTEYTVADRKLRHHLCNRKSGTMQDRHSGPDIGINVNAFANHLGGAKHAVSNSFQAIIRGRWAAKNIMPAARSFIPKLCVSFSKTMRPSARFALQWIMLK